MRLTYRIEPDLRVCHSTFPLEGHVSPSFSFRYANAHSLKCAFISFARWYCGKKSEVIRKREIISFGSKFLLSILREGIIRNSSADGCKMAVPRGAAKRHDHLVNTRKRGSPGTLTPIQRWMRRFCVIVPHGMFKDKAKLFAEIFSRNMST